MRKIDLLRYQKALSAAKQSERPDHVERINALTRNARSAWFGLLAALVFVLVTLAGVEHIDFYGVNRTTQLPLVNVSVPTRLFFIAAPLLTASIYIYFHLYLIRLFDALGAAPARIGKEPLSQAITPWLINDAVLWVRRRNRGDDCHPKRRLENLSTVFNFLLVWCFGLFVLGFSWITAFPARDYLMNGIGAVSFCLALVFAIASYITLRETALELKPRRIKVLRNLGSGITVTVCLVFAGLSISFAHPTSPWLARLDLTGQDIVERPIGWLPYQIARRDFLDIWRKREGVTEAELSPTEQLDFDAEWSQRRQLALSDFTRPDFDGNGSQILLTNAILERAFLSGLNFSDAQMEGAHLRRAKMEGADLSDAQMEGADLNDAQMERANLRYAQMEGADLSGAQMEGANLRYTQMEGVDLSGARMEGVDFDASLLTGRPEKLILLQLANLSASTNTAGALRFVDFTLAEFDAKTDFRNAFMDATVVIPAELRELLGDQCQSRLDETLSDEEFFGRWLGWLEATGYDFFVLINHPELGEFTPIEPDPGCEWKTGPMPGVEYDDTGEPPRIRRIFGVEDVE